MPSQLAAKLGKKSRQGGSKPITVDVREVTTESGDAQRALEDDYGTVVACPISVTHNLLNCQELGFRVLVAAVSPYEP